MMIPTLPQTLTVLLLCVTLILTPEPARCSDLRSVRSHGSHHPDRGTGPIAEDTSELERLALAHSERVFEAGSCDAPKLQVIHVSDHYPDRYFLPHCTLLHRCGRHAGCCGTDRLRCVAAEKEKVTLHFYSVRVMGDGVPAKRRIEKITFSNHTRCACVPNEHHNSQNDL